MDKNKFFKKLISLLVLILLSGFVFAQKTQQQLEKEIATLKKQIEAKQKEIEKNKATQKKANEKKQTVLKTTKDTQLAKASKSSTTSKSKLITVEKENGDSNIGDIELKKTSKVYTGTASFYSDKFEGRRTANGEIFKHAGFTAACNQLPLGTWLKVTNLQNNKTVIVKVNDRMHPKMNRLVDLTLAAAKKLGFVDKGLTKVKAEVIKHK